MKKKLTLLMLSALMLTGCAVDSSVSSDTKTSESASTADSEIMKIYDSYKTNGGTLSYEEWLASIKGEKGDKGDDGMDGKDGTNGIDGKDGADGRSITGITKTSSSGNEDTYTITYSDGTTSTFTVNNGKDGKDGIDGTDGKDGEKGEKGDTGDTGEAGKDGTDGKSAYELYCERHPEYKGTEDEWLDELTTGKLNRITISFDTYGGSTMDDVTTSFGSYITVDAPSRNGYEFDGWTLNGSDIDVNTYVFFASCTLKAKWKKVTYTIKYVLDDGTNDVSNPYEYDIETDDITLADAKKPYYEFEGWYTDSKFTNRIDSIRKGSYGDLNLYAKYSVKEYTVTYNLDDGTNADGNPSKYNHYSDTITLSDPTKEGYSFKGWYRESTFENRVTSIPTGSEGDITLYAKWDEMQYSISYNLYGGTNDASNPTSYNDESEDIILKSPTKEYHDFKGWYTDADFTNRITYIASGTTGDITLYAKWDETQYSISYSLYGGTNDVSNPTSYTISSEDITLADPTKDGYTFEGWYTDSSFSTKSASIRKGSNGNVTFYANWSASITYVLDDGTNDSSNPSTYETKDGDITLKDASKTGYTFMGWYKDEDFSEKVTSINAKDGDITLYAKFMTKSEALGITPVVSKNGKYVTYGLYPQTEVSDSTLTSTLNAFDAQANGWYSYKNKYYAKSSSSWYVCEPIMWKVLESDDGGNYKLLSNVILDRHIYNKYYSGTDENGYYANNYAHSEIRTWLNGTFYDTAFSLDNTAIQTTTVDNSAATTMSTDNTYACEDTVDKVYLLSYQDYLNTSYGFSDTISRQCKATEYARAMKVSCDSDYNGYYWTRSPISDNSRYASYVSKAGSLTSSCDSLSLIELMNVDYSGVRPSLSVKIS
jgi:uncharacterized repeat protein (TIGR02543 family)